MLDFSQFTTLTFDCYGTLIDWETGIAETLGPMLAAHGNRSVSRAELIACYAGLEEAAEREPYKPYRDVLAEVVRGLGSQYGFEPTERELGSLAESLPSWRPFSDTVDALRRLKTRFKLGVISNVDDDLFARTSELLGKPFEYVVTAQSVGSYKPDHANFIVGLDRMGVNKSEVLHVAQSLFHDIEPANALGIRCVWVNRSGARHGFGSVRPVSATPDLTVPDLTTLADVAR